MYASFIAVGGSLWFIDGQLNDFIIRWMSVCIFLLSVHPFWIPTELLTYLMYFGCNLKRKKFRAPQFGSNTCKLQICRQHFSKTKTD